MNNSCRNERIRSLPHLELCSQQLNFKMFDHFLFVCVLSCLHLCSADKPEILKFQPLLQLKQGSTFMLTCSILQGESPYKFQWFKDDHPLTSKDSLQIDTKDGYSFLRIPNVHWKDSGNYTCSVTNRFGLDKQSTTLHVKGLDLSFVFLFSAKVWRQVCWFETRIRSFWLNNYSKADQPVHCFILRI